MDGTRSIYPDLALGLRKIEYIDNDSGAIPN